jgi:hypothetical protein
MESENIKSKYAVQQELHEFNKGLAFAFAELYSNASQVSKELADLHKRVSDNQAKWGAHEHLFWGTSTASSASDFERAFAKYETAERIFLTMCYANGFSTAEAQAMVISARMSN